MSVLGEQTFEPLGHSFAPATPQPRGPGTISNTCQPASVEGANVPHAEPFRRDEIAVAVRPEGTEPAIRASTMAVGAVWCRKPAFRRYGVWDEMARGAVVVPHSSIHF